MHHGTRSDENQTATGHPCPPGIPAHGGGNTRRNGNGSDHQMIPPAHLNPKRVEENGKNHPKREYRQQVTETVVPPTPRRNPKAPEEEEGARPTRARPPR